MTTQNGTTPSTVTQANSNQNRTSTIIAGSDGLTMLDHGRELNIGIITPVGTSFRARSRFIGTHSNRMILVELPKISDDKLQAFFQEGFWATIRTISPRGEGAILTFRSQILHIIRTPIAMVAMSLPQTMQSTSLRDEPRYDASLVAKVQTKTHRIDCEIRDISKNGCLYITPALTRAFELGEQVHLHIKVNGFKDHPFEPLSGQICNINQSSQKRLYGVKFDDNGKLAAATLLTHLKFDGTKLSL